MGSFMRYEIKLRIVDNSPAEVVYEAVFSKDAIYKNESADKWHQVCLEMGREGKKLSEILVEMTKMVIELERVEDGAKH